MIEGMLEFAELADRPDELEVVRCLDARATHVIVPATANDVPVTRIGKKAFYGMEQLEEVELPSSITEIADFAFFRAGIKHLALPQRTMLLGVKAFGLCKSLQSVDFNDCLKTIGQECFMKSGLRHAELPGSLENLSCSAFSGSAMDFDGNAAVSFAPESPYRFHEGVLYREESDGLVLMGPLGTPVTCEALPQTTRVEDGAFAGCFSLTRFIANEGLAHIGAKAFASCSMLNEVQLPQSLVSLGAECFWETAVEHLYFGPQFAELGTGALAVCGLGKAGGSKIKPLKSVEVSPANRSFSFEGGVLYRLDAEGKPCSVVACLSMMSPYRVTVPASVTRVEPHAFAFSRVGFIEFLSKPHTVEDYAFRSTVGLVKMIVEGVVWEFPGCESNPPAAFHSEHAGFGKSFGSDFSHSSMRLLGVSQKGNAVLVQGENGEFPSLEEYDAWVDTLFEPYYFLRAGLCRLNIEPLCEDRKNAILERMKALLPTLCKECARNEDIASLKQLNELIGLSADHFKVATSAAAELHYTKFVADVLELEHASVSDEDLFDFSL